MVGQDKSGLLIHREYTSAGFPNYRRSKEHWYPLTYPPFIH